MIVESAAAALVAPGVRALGASEKVGVGLIGNAGRGLDDTRNFIRRSNVEVLAACDVNSLFFARK